MLKSLLIKNFALIDSLEIEFSRGLNIITGETGAGKSVIVEALLMALGERASSNLIREGEKKAVIEGVFKLTNKSSINILLEENQIDTCDERDSSTSHRMTGDDERDSSTSLRMTGDDERDSSTSLRMTGDDKRDSSTSHRMTGDDERDSSTSHRMTNDIIIIRRELNDKGNSRCFINDTPVNLALLKKIGALLVDFHGQHDHQLLLNRETHITLLDLVADIEKIKKNYLILYNSLNEKIRQLRELRRNESILKAKEESLRFELNEIEKIGPKPAEESLLEQELNVIQNSELLHNLINELNTILNDDENSAYTQLNKSGKILDRLFLIEPKFKDYSEEISRATVTINEITKFSNYYLHGLQFDQARIDEIRERLSLLKGLRKKYGTYNAIFERWTNLENEINLIANYDDEISELEKEVINLKKQAGEKAFQLTEIRKKASMKLDKSVVQSLKTVGIENSVFRTVISNKELETDSSTSLRMTERKDSSTSLRMTDVAVMINGKSYIGKPDGIDDVEFFISTNKGETPKPLANIASGGEISRVMLALKSIVADSDKLPILVFDEIDIGISGRIAQKVGNTMKDLSKNHQIIAITHLPQIAALGDRNIRVEKSTKQGRTLINCELISENEKIEEIARLLSGDKVTPTSLKTASELIKGN